MAPKFNGFPPSLFKFLTDLAANNNKQWFEENKSRYQDDVVAPVCAFIDAIAPRLQKISNCFIADARPHGGSMFRIYRDTRFSKDKRPYKQNVGCHFRHMAGKNAHAPGFYLHLEPENVFMGGGIWQPGGDALSNIRAFIDANTAQWQRISEAKTIQRWGGIQGERLKRPPRGYSDGHPCIDSIKQKSFYVMAPVEQASAEAAGFITQVERVYKDISPLMEFLSKAVGLPFRQEIPEFDLEPM